MFTDWRQLPATVMGLQAGGIIWRGIVPWHKPGARPIQGRWTNECEYMVWGSLGPRPLEGSPFSGFYSFRAPVNREHITQKPVELFTGLLEAVPVGGVVLDPFAGSGTTLRAAKDIGRRAVGVELDSSYCDVIVKRCAQEVLFG